MDEGLLNVIEQMGSAGLEGLAPIDLVVDGKIHRFKPEGEKKDHGWYVLFDFVTDSGLRLVSGTFGSWKLGISQNINLKTGQAKLSDEDRERFRAAQREKVVLVKQAREDEALSTAERAKGIWEKLPKEGRSPYLDRKKVKAYGIRFSRGSIVIPIRGIDGVLWSLQFISATESGSDKRFLSGSAIKSHYHAIGRITPESPLVVVEDYATGATIHQVTGWSVAMTFGAGNLEAVAKTLRASYPSIQIIIAGDDDRWTKGNPGVSKAQKAAAAVSAVAVFPVFKGSRDGTDFNDLFVVEGAEPVFEQLNAALVPKTDWRTGLSRTASGAIRPVISNVAKILKHDPDWQAVLGYCDFSYRIVKQKKPPFKNADAGEWSDADTARLRIWLSEKYGITPSTRDTDDAVLVASEARRFHPVRDYLKGLEWDGLPRLENWLTTYLDANDGEYERGAGRKYLISAVARVMEPPVKVDHVLILESIQGVKKSTVLDVLASPWFSDTYFAIGDKDGYQQMQGVWIYELAELDSFNKAESTRAKQFFGSITDHYRPSYGRRVQEFPRQCVFVGTTNQESYLKDPTGNRRYWPVRCGLVDIEALRRDREQLWAEAVAQHKNGVPWWPVGEEEVLFGEQQEQRYTSDAWEDMVYSWLYDASQGLENKFTAAEIFKGALSCEAMHMRLPEQTRLGIIMSRLGWKKHRERYESDKDTPDRRYVYHRPPHQIIMTTNPEDEAA